MADLDQTIEDAAKSPKAVAVDGVRVDAQSVDELLKADQYLQAKNAIKTSPRRGLRFNKLVPPGACSDS
jgi:hypothetical protein